MARRLFAIKGSLFSFYVLQAVLLPYLPIYFGNQGYTPVQIGWLMNIGPFVAMFAQPVWGYYSDKYQSIKSIIAVLWALTILSSVGLFMAGSFTVAFWFVMLLYFFMYPSIPLLDSLTVKTIRKTRSSYGSVRLWGSVGFMACALLSGYMLAIVGGIDRVGYLFWGLWILPFFFLFILKDERGPESGPKVRLRDIGFLMRNKTFLWFLFLVLLVSIPHRINDVMLTLHLADLGASEKQFGIAWAIAAFGEIPAFALLSRYLHRFHELAVIGVTAVLYSVRWAAFAWIDDPLLLVVLQVSHSVTFALFWMAAIQYTVRLVPKEMGTTGQALVSSVFLGLAGLIGGIAGGWFKQQFGGSEMYLFGAALSLGAAALLFGTRQYRRLKGLE